MSLVRRTTSPPWRRAALGALTLILLCSASAAYGGTTKHSSKRSATPIRIVSDISPNPGIILLAQQLGYLDKEGISVTIDPQSNPTLVPPALVSGQYDIGFSTPPQVIDAHSQ